MDIDFDEDVDPNSDKEILRRLEKLRRPARKPPPGAKWDGRVSTLSLTEFRDRRWSLDAGFGKTMRGGASYTMRPMLPNPMFKSRSNSNPTFQKGDVHKSFKAASATAPCWSMGKSSFAEPKSKSPGPAEYQIKSTMDPESHPTLDKHQGARFSSGTLKAADDFQPPGPGEYSLEGFEASSVMHKKPTWSLGGREAWNERFKEPMPDPGEYDPSAALRNGKKTPITWNMQGKTLPIEPARGMERQCPVPPPWHYDPPGAPDCRNHHCEKPKPPKWPMMREPRGLL
eukprot:TRINITY_DN53986_c0_g1_i1.p1 TRINITY_DN53986_c0_g1~~TRINITY_DN53986_c0_g1_i1.p1  ORF type:complete len:304 (-),score=53.02 TRINITY_DN53986_c0_g1_i1:119-973(-)